MVRQIAARVEAIRGLRFRGLPRLEVMSEARLAALGRRLARQAQRREDSNPTRVRRMRRLERASVRFDQLAGLLPPQVSFGPDARGGLDRIGGAYDYKHRRIVLVPGFIQTWVQLQYTLAHELTHALEDQHFNLRLDALTQPGEATAVRRAVTEGTATYVQDRYRQRYLHDQLPVRQRLQGMRSVIGAGGGAYAVNAQAVFDYVDGAIFVRDLVHRSGDWRLVRRALERPPHRSQQLLHPRTWPQAAPVRRIRLGIANSLKGSWVRIGGGPAGEEQALTILLAGTIDSEALVGASGWDGGRFAVWRPRASSSCGDGCAARDVGVIAFRWHHATDPHQFGLAVPAYMIAGLFAQPINERTWRIGDGYAALGTAARASALAFAPTASLSESLASRAAQAAAGSG
jgi:hypothetical protein